MRGVAFSRDGRMLASAASRWHRAALAQRLGPCRKLHLAAGYVTAAQVQEYLPEGQQPTACTLR